jgi:predicted DCC family thiol-disulfide oxidoreductase YuxK
VTDDVSDDPVVLFDGICNLCVGSLPWLLRMDRRDRLRFGTLQSEAGTELLEECGLSGTYDESMVVVEGDRAYTESDAVVRIAWLLGFPWALGSVASIVPKRIRDRVYRWVADSRYEWFGKREQCLVPDDELRERFID